MQTKELTKAEEQVMHYLWDMERGYLKNVVEKFSEPKPAYTTVSTVIRVLVRKEFIGYKTHGKVNEYYPLISRNDYFKRRLKPIISNYFRGSSTEFASYFANERLNLTELEEIKRLIEEKIKMLKSRKRS